MLAERVIPLDAITRSNSLSVPGDCDIFLVNKPSTGARRPFMDAASQAGIKIETTGFPLHA